MLKSDPFLGRLYKRYNKKYFDNALPNNVFVVWKKLKGKMGDCTPYDDGSWRIRLNPDYENFYKLTMLHEQNHIATVLHHGKEFQDGMLALAIKGAFKGLW